MYDVQIGLRGTCTKNKPSLTKFATVCDSSYINALILSQPRREIGVNTSTPKSRHILHESTVQYMLSTYN